MTRTNTGLTARTPQGTVVGRSVSTPDGSAVAFLGIPYAHAERFKAPQPAMSWPGERLCVAAGPAAPQDPIRADVMDESGCLNANVWVPANAAASPLPVLVWIHGGGHLYGSNTNALCDGARLAAAEGIIVVAINYRLGALGYLSLASVLGSEYADSSNLALLDAVAALRWVSVSIAEFGGDPARVTIMGQSAGAVMVASLLAMPSASGLFSRALIESGSGERARDAGHGERLTADLLTELAATPTDLLTMPAEQIVAGQEALVRRRSAGRPNLDLAFAPLIDGRTLTARPVDLIREGASADVELVIGTNRNEASGFVDLRAEPAVDVLEAHVEQLMHGSPAASVVTYRAALDADTNRPNSLAETLEACMADLIYRQPSQRLLDARRDASAWTRSYLFEWQRPDADWIRRAGHSLELPFIFRHIDDSADAEAEVGVEPPLQLRDQMSAMWGALVRDEDLQPWPTYGEHRRTAIFSEHFRIESDPRGSIRRLVAQHNA
ncbi:carboxylesterase family protein [Curtobacterium sp. MCLR17_007]|uniref:carboxylesterase/lipase family protein n=1 Tax=Curtobacterium sp. MCLR17_007 TaxID=2175648 RepID=UPI0015E8C7FC|nr:carboxylesterase family protein [Curtobacterium sp. MCLR17_007]WIB60446.1 carboxylesterase family protein [Curtobacterium sp. MCLR17_007]